MFIAALLATFWLCGCAQAAPQAEPAGRNLFVFGSSWSTTKFDVDGHQPDTHGPLGNPGFDDTDNLEGGPNYVKYLTEKENSTKTYLYDFATSGTVIDDSLLGLKSNAASPDLRAQVTKVFEPKYSDQIDKLWKSDNTIFIVWMCDNDVFIGASDTKHPNKNDLRKSMLDSWTVSVEDLYAHGARKFLFLNVPSQERSPLILGKNQQDRADYTRFKILMNADLLDTYKAFGAKHADAHTEFFDVNGFMISLLDDPECHGFDKDPTCMSAEDKCIWNNDFHTTSAVHKLMAHAMAPQMKRLGY